MATGAFLAGVLEGNVGLFRMTLGDFTEAEMLVRPVAGANHAAWQLGHLIVAEQGMMSGCGAKMPALSADFKERFSKERAKIDEAGAFASKGELLDLFAQVRAATAAFAKGCSEEDLAKPGPEKMRALCPTVGAALAVQQGHAMMHLGQMQVIRRKLGKTVLF